ncbi:single-stranded DNA-binding protein [Roseimarinus sediminis]|jgi:single-strand DNA-binding protein|uniref:single-stranded DNA-binding protein n=1 Tax=Roseimarinus sediminis TaxID=1610899 RepID=UPI003D218B75
MSVNKVILVGNAGKDAEVRYIDSGVAVATFSLATSETYTAKSGERVTNTEWHNIVAWRGLAEMAGKYIQKGKQMYIEGRIRTRSYDDKDGVKKYITEILADNIQLLGRKDDTQHATSANEYQQKNESASNVSEPNEMDSGDNVDDLPF